MGRSIYWKYISCLMVLVILAISVTGFCPDTCAAELPDNLNSGHCTAGAIDGHCPSSPVNDHAASDQYDPSCHCPCHAPLTTQPVQITCSQRISPLLFIDPFKAIPEVFLSRFIPPQNRA